VVQGPVTNATLLGDLTVLAQVLMIDLVLAGDNAVVIGLAVAGLKREQRRRAILLGLAAATAIRIALALVTLRLLALIGLTLAGGLLLLWVCWRMYRELRRQPHAAAPGGTRPKRLRAAMLQIALADLSMSLDNVLAVAGAAHDRPWVMAAGLLVSVLLTAVAAQVVARLLERHRWIAWVGLAIVVYVALDMIWQGSHQVARAM
jgi:YjbE family integral membrane protein